MPEEPQIVCEDRVIVPDSKIADYQLLVDTKAKYKTSDIIPNAGEVHAAIAMAKLFDETNSKVRMIVGSFSGPVCDQPNYLKSLHSCINKGVLFRIIHIEDLNIQSVAYNMLNNSMTEGRDIVFHKASEGFKDKISIDNSIKHFAVFDDDKYRFETDVDKYVAFLCFNNKKTASLLSNVFDAELEG